MRRVVLGLILVSLALLVAGPACALADSEGAGTDYWLGFPQVYEAGVSRTFELLITGSAASGTVTVPGTAFTQSFTTTPGATTTVVLPAAVEDQSPDSVQTGHAIHVSADQPVKVNPVFLGPGLSDGYLGLPTEALGASYRVLDFQTNPTCGKAEFELIGTQAATTVTITSSVSIGIHPAGTPYTESLGAGSTYLAQSILASGTTVAADHPIALLAGNSCGQVPVGTAAGNFLVEEMPPTQNWGSDYSVVPFAGRAGGDVIVILGSQNATPLSVTSAAGSPAGAPSAVNSGQAVSFSASEPVRISAGAPVLVGHFAKGYESDSPDVEHLKGDPTMVLVPPREHYAHSQTVTTPASGFATDFVNVTLATADIGSLKLDGVAVDAAAFHQVGLNASISGAQLPIAAGTHTFSDDGPFGTEVYGFDPTADAFGWPGAWGDGSRVPAPPLGETPTSTLNPAAGPFPLPLAIVNRKSLKCRKGFKEKTVKGKQKCVKKRKKRHQRRH